MGTKRKRDHDPQNSQPDLLPFQKDAHSPAAPTLPPTSPRLSSQPIKLPRLPPNLTLSKRPLLRPPIPSKHAATQKTVYVSARTPFMSAAKRVVKLLSLADKRATQSALDSVKRGKDGRRYGREAGDDRGRPGELDEAAKMAARIEGGEKGEVVLRGTGRAIEKVMGLGVWFLQREEYGVRIRTGSVGAVDDVVEKEGEGGVEMEGAEGEEDDGVEVPGSRIRYASMVEVVVSRR